MENNQTSMSKEQEQQARNNKKAASSDKPIYDKKLDGPNRPSV